MKTYLDNLAEKLYSAYGKVSNKIEQSALVDEVKKNFEIACSQPFISGYIITSMAVGSYEVVQYASDGRHLIPEIFGLVAVLQGLTFAMQRCLYKSVTKTFERKEFTKVMEDPIVRRQAQIYAKYSGRMKEFNDALKQYLSETK